MDREGVKDALTLKEECERRNCAEGMRTFLSVRKSELDTDANGKTGSDISLDQEEEFCNNGDMTKGRHPQPDVLRERPLSESHPRILSVPDFYNSPSKRLRTEGPSTYNENISTFKIYMHSEESSVSKTSKSYLPAAGIIESEREQTTTSGDILKK